MRKTFLPVLLIVAWAVVLLAAEAVPEYVKLVIKDGRVGGANFESARTPVVRTALRGDVLEADIRAEFPPGRAAASSNLPSRPGRRR